MNDNYVKATSENLPKVDLEMFLEYLSSSNNFQSAETRGVKALRSMRENYGDRAIGYVQLQRKNSICTVQAKISPEHKVRNKNYTVYITVDENEEKVETAECQDCPASLGGCKHALAVLAWLYRRSEEPSTTSVSCYWKKPVLSKVGSEIKFQKISELFPHKSVKDEHTEEQNFNILDLVLNDPRATDSSAHIVKFYRVDNNKKLSLHYISLMYDGDKTDVMEFRDFCASFFNEQNCNDIFASTLDQSSSSLWYELRYARITASIIYDAAVCATENGSLVEKILGHAANFDTIAMKRGRNLEKHVIEVIEGNIKKQYKETISESGLILNKKYPMLGASPDGLTKSFVIEVKCPYTEKSVSRFYKNGQLQLKYKAQFHLQMLFAEKKQGLFCIADPEFESNKKVEIIKENYDDGFIQPIIEKAITFWTKAIFPKLISKNQK